MKIIVAHPGKQHSFKTAEALNKNNHLFKYITTVYDGPKSYTALLKFILPSKLFNKVNTRKSSLLTTADIIQFNEIYGLLNLILLRIPVLKKFHSLYSIFITNEFGVKVARYAIKHNVDAVIMYDTTSNKCWSILLDEAPHIKRILDVTIASRLFMKENYIKDMERTGDNYFKIEQQHLWIENNMVRYKEEFRKSEYFIVASNVVKESLLFSGVLENKIAIIPYGVDIDKFEFKQHQKFSLPLKIIYVGEISYRKGIHHLLKVISKFCGQNVDLYLCGDFKGSSKLFNEYKNSSNIHFLGFVTRDVLAKKYADSDVFILPTLGEGYGLVVLEALSVGLPCIVSDLAGGNDAIIDGYNGFEFPAGDNLALKSTIQWFIDNPTKLSEMSINSRKSVLNQTWESYDLGLNDFMEQVIKNEHE